MEPSSNGREVAAGGARGAPEPAADGEEASESPLTVTDVVQRGTGLACRFDMTLGVAGRHVRIVGLPARHILSYRKIAAAAVAEGLVLPYFRHANARWRGILSAAMERATFEPSLEGEEIAEAIVAEIRASLVRRDRGSRAEDLTSGRVVPEGDRLLVSPKAVVDAVRSRLVDDVLPGSVITEAAASRLGMREVRPRLPGAATRPRAWAFPTCAMAEPRSDEQAAEAAVGPAFDDRVGAAVWTGPGPRGAQRIANGRGHLRVGPLDREKENAPPRVR
jgi:hypothetical protein